MEKIIIFYGSYGGGHLSAARNIKSYIENNYSEYEVELIDCIEYVNKTLNKVTTSAFTSFSKNARWVWKRIYYKSEKGALSNISNSINKIMSHKLGKLIQKENPKLIISTHPFSSQMCSILKKKQKINCKLATVMTDYAPHNQWIVLHNFVDYYFVAHAGMKSDLINRGLAENKIYVTGIPLSDRFLLQYDKKSIYDQFNLSPNKHTVLFFAGGEYGFGKDKILNMLKSLIEGINDLQIVAVAGRNEKLKEHFDELVSQTNTSNRVKILSFTNQVPELMNISDLVITKPGGLTTTESLASGLPMLVIDPLPGQEEENSDFIERNGAGIRVRETDSIKDILVDILNTPNKLQDLKNSAKAVAKRNSTKDICNILLG